MLVEEVFLLRPWLDRQRKATVYYLSAISSTAMLKYYVPALKNYAHLLVRDFYLRSTRVKKEQGKR